MSIPQNHLIQLEQVGNILSNIGNKLITNNNLLKLIIHDSSNALSLSNPTIQDIIAITGRGSDPINQQRFYKYPFTNKILDTPRTELRYFAPNVKPNNIYLSELNINFQVVIHNSLIELDNNKLRYWEMVGEILSSLNGHDCGGIGLLNLKTPISIVSWSDNFSGYTWNMCTRSV